MPRSSSKRAPQTTTGALPTTTEGSDASKTSTVASVIASPAVKGSVGTTTGATPATTRGRVHQTHGAVTPITGPITNVTQLMNGGRNVAKGAAGSFGSLDEYGSYLRTLSLGDLHSHAVTERTVPIDDRERLIRRLEVAWTGNKGRYPGSAAGAAIPQRKGFTQEQMAAQQELMKKAMRR